MVNLPSFLNKKAGFKQFDKENRSSNLDFSDRAPANFVVPLSPSPNALLAASLSPRGSQPAPRMNESENLRLQGLMRPASMISVDGDNSGGRGGGAGSGAVTRWDRLRVYFINEGSRKVFVGVWMLLHAMVFTFGFLNVRFFFLFRVSAFGVRAGGLMFASDDAVPAQGCDFAGAARAPSESEPPLDT